MIGRDVLDQLYGGAPEDFVATRTALARAARENGDRDLATAIGELRKPTVPAWAVNVLTRERPAEVDRLLDLGRVMREAQSRLDTDALRDLRRERDAALDSFTRAARFVADAHGHPLSMAAATALRSTAVAAIADEKAADAVRSGTLVRTLEYAGFGEVDLDDAVAQAAVHLGHQGRGESGADSEAGGSDTDAASATDSDAARQLRRERLTAAVAETDQELARASLVEAESVRLAEKAAGRVDELDRLLTRARAEAETRASEAAAATAARERAAAAHAEARRRLDAAD